MSFCPHFRSPMSKLFRFSKFFGKTNEKKWSQIWILLLIKGVKSLRKKVWFLTIFALLAGLSWYRCYYPRRLRDALSHVCGIFYIYHPKSNWLVLNMFVRSLFTQFNEPIYSIETAVGCMYSNYFKLISWCMK